jgi:threonine synthase
MLYYSTNKISKPVSLSQAVLKGLAIDGGLYMPERIPKLSDSFFQSLHGMGLHDIATEVVSSFLSDDVAIADLKVMATETLSFDIPLVEVEPGIFSLELFHGPTMAFKDVGARFMSRLMAYLHHGSNDNNKGQTAEIPGQSSAADSNDPQPLKVVVATSGDTGSAVAAGFFDVDGIEVYVLFPRKKVSPLQQKQITTWGRNIHAIEVDGTFDDCQRLAKQVLNDDLLNNKYLLTSANSINIARLIPQAIYYFYAAAQLKDPDLPLVFSVPSGNFGNLTAGLLASIMGLPVRQFIAATNINDVVPEYATRGLYRPRPSMQTISNAMDVGDPSNFARMLELFNHDHHNFCESIYTCSFTDEQTLKTIEKVYRQTGYMMDPHGAVAYMGLKKYLSAHAHPTNMIFLETAHPAKFSESIEGVVGEIPLPPQLQQVKDKAEHFVSIPNELEALKAIIAAE